ncbi:GntR family transcriptional regulator [Bacillus alveayuensis]|uniref:GntR family transcriptional regulator n=1 Tax=Aeribacillus alveayuensis TaxID=279215 RepID=UPI0005D1261B|nr:GntR family transcriptional regulator [Bacillus alveayuensis]
MLNRNHRVPLYEQLKDIIKKNIEEGIYKVGEQIPSERTLCETYNVSRITVRQAIALAEKEGLLQRLQGVGTFVRKPKIKQELSNFNSFQSTLSQQGLIAKTKLVHEEIISSDIQLSRVLNISVMDKVYHLELLGLGDEKPIVFYNSYFSEEVGLLMKKVADEALAENMPFSTLDLYKKTDKLNPTHVEQTFEAKAASSYIADQLQVDVATPILTVTSIVYEENEPLEFKETHYRGDKYKFFTIRKMND